MQDQIHVLTTAYDECIQQPLPGLILDLLFLLPKHSQLVFFLSFFLLHSLLLLSWNSRSQNFLEEYALRAEKVLLVGQIQDHTGRLVASVGCA